MPRVFVVVAGIAVVVAAGAGEAAHGGPRYAQDGTPSPTGTSVWRLDRLDRIGDRPVTVLGDPRIVDTEHGRAVAFDGLDDGLLVDGNPIAGFSQFTIEVLFQPAPGGPEEQRFLHVEEARSGNRALVELRMRPDSQWALDTYLRSGPSGLTLLDRERVHPAGQWHTATLTYDGRRMTHYVNGRRELSGETTFAPLGTGKTSIGVRQNRVSWFRGRIHTIRFSPEVLPASRRLSTPGEESIREREVIPLWPEGVPGAQANGGVERVVD